MVNNVNYEKDYEQLFGFNKDFFNKQIELDPSIAKVIDENFYDLLATTKSYTKFTFLKDLKSYLICEKIISSIDIAKEISFYKNPLYKEFLDTLNLLLKNKYYQNDIKFYTTISISNESLYNLRIFSSSFLAKGHLYYPFELSYDKFGTQKFKLKHLFQSQYELNLSNDNNLLNKFEAIVNKIEIIFKQYIQNFINFESEYSKYLLNVSKKKYQYKMNIENYLNNKLNSKNYNILIANLLKKHFLLENEKFKITLSSNNEHSLKYKNNINYQATFCIAQYSYTETIGLTYSHEHFKTIGYIDFSLSKKEKHFEVEILKNFKLLKKNTSVVKFLKLTFFKSLLNYFSQSFKD